MLNRTTFFISRRFLSSITREKNVFTMLTVCFLSILIGTFALALIAAIMNGFEKTTRETLQGVNNDITIQSHHRQPLAFDRIETVLTTEFNDSIAVATPYAHNHAIIQTEYSNDISHIVLIKAIDAKRETLANRINSKLTSNTHFDNNKLVVGKTLAQELDLEIGEEINIIHSTDTQPHNRKVTFDSTPLTIGGFFETGIEEFDEYTVFCSHKTLKKLFPETGITQIGITLKPNNDNQTIIKKLKKRFNLDVFSWHERYKPLIAALALEKYAMILILALVTLVASMNIISLLFMYITQKRGIIAIFKAMGMEQKTIRSIFITVGMIISCGAGACGLVLACTASWALEKFKLISLPDVYYTSHVPADMTPAIVALVIAIVGLVSLGATWLATRSIKHLNIAKIVKSEA